MCSSLKSTYKLLLLILVLTLIFFILQVSSNLSKCDEYEFSTLMIDGVFNVVHGGDEFEVDITGRTINKVSSGVKIYDEFTELATEWNAVRGKWYSDGSCVHGEPELGTGILVLERVFSEDEVREGFYIEFKCKSPGAGRIGISVIPYDANSSDTWDSKDVVFSVFASIDKGIEYYPPYGGSSKVVPEADKWTYIRVWYRVEDNTGVYTVWAYSPKSGWVEIVEAKTKIAAVKIRLYVDSVYEGIYDYIVVYRSLKIKLKNVFEGCVIQLLSTRAGTTGSVVGRVYFVQNPVTEYSIDLSSELLPLKDIQIKVAYAPCYVDSPETIRTLTYRFKKVGQTIHVIYEGRVFEEGKVTFSLPRKVNILNLTVYTAEGTYTFTPTSETIGVYTKQVAFTVNVVGDFKLYCTQDPLVKTFTVVDLNRTLENPSYVYANERIKLEMSLDSAMIIEGKDIYYKVKIVNVIRGGTLKIQELTARGTRIEYTFTMYPTTIDIEATLHHPTQYIWYYDRVIQRIILAVNLTLTGVNETLIGEYNVFTIRVTSAAIPIEGIRVILQRQSDGIWISIGEAVTDSYGVARVNITLPELGPTLLRAVIAPEQPLHATPSNVLRVVVYVPTSLSLEAPESVRAGEPITLRVAVISPAGNPTSGIIVFYKSYDNKTWYRIGNVTLTGMNIARIVFREFKPVKLYVKAVYLGFNYYYNSTSSIKVINVGKRQAIIELKAPLKMYVATPFLVKLKLRDINGTGLPGRNVILQLLREAEPILNKTLTTGSRGIAECKIIAPKPGVYIIKAIFKGDIIYENCTSLRKLEAERIPTRILLKTPVTKIYVTREFIVKAILVMHNNTPIPSAILNLYINEKLVASGATNKRGEVPFKVRLEKAGINIIRVEFKGSPIFNPSTVITKIRAIKIPTKIVFVKYPTKAWTGREVEIRACIVDYEGKPLRGQTLVLLKEVRGKWIKILSNASNSDGWVIFKVKESKGGRYTYKVVYPGSNIYEACSSMEFTIYFRSRTMLIVAMTSVISILAAVIIILRRRL